MPPKPPKTDQKTSKSDENKAEDGGNGQTVAETLPEAVETVKVKFLRSHPELAYHPGEVADLPKCLYDKYLEAGPFYEAVAA